MAFILFYFFTEQNTFIDISSMQIPFEQKTFSSYRVQ